jgi:hypothetical protein
MAMILAAAPPPEAARPATPPEAARPATPPEDAITVEATRLSAEQVRASSNAYVKAGLNPNPAYGQYARWKGPLCINVRGIPDPAVAARVQARVSAVATDVGLAVQKPGCKPNLTVAFTDDARGLVAQVRAKKPTALPRFEPRLYAGLASPSLPVRWWHVLTPAGPGGGAAGSVDSGALASALTNGEGGGLSAGPDAIGTNSWNSSLIDTNLSIWARAGVAVVDVNLATGVPLDALADYVALVMLAPMRLPPDQPGVPSVLSLFATDAPRPAGMSSWDRAFLKGLYSIQMNRAGARQRQQLINAMAADVAGNGDPARP